MIPQTSGFGLWVLGFRGLQTSGPRQGPEPEVRTLLERRERAEHLLVVRLVARVLEHLTVAHAPFLSITKTARFAMPLRPTMSSLNTP